MSGCGKGDKVKRRKSRYSRVRPRRGSEMWFIGLILKYLRRGNYAENVRGDASAYLAGVLDYLAAEILDLAGVDAILEKKTRICPRHLRSCIRIDTELTRLISRVLLPKEIEIEKKA
ncbi:Histone H2A [Trachymyrmex septentrionalis]|uniref:Histone H2A n=1 Tax=Trachymyrmex septentrionalis TaxID=34720 RepID=A0A195F3H3_9HYME|nr:PREDICTED: histone H2A-beta, sperm-like [Trachymyrmex septentrionalis]KYN35130.1 Histone H2A [Trachymyrmex septentrionalis]